MNESRKRRCVAKNPETFKRHNQIAFKSRSAHKFALNFISIIKISSGLIRFVDSHRSYAQCAAHVHVLIALMRSRESIRAKKSITFAAEDENRRKATEDKLKTKLIQSYSPFISIVCLDFGCLGSFLCVCARATVHSRSFAGKMNSCLRLLCVKHAIRGGHHFHLEH